MWEEQSTNLQPSHMDVAWGVSPKTKQGCSHHPYCCHSVAFPRRPHGALVPAKIAEGQGKVPKREKERGRNILEAPAAHLPSVIPYKQGLVNLRTLARYSDRAPVVPNK